MGSFYGTTFQELKEAFKKLIVKGYKKDPVVITAESTEDAITFESGDKWIVLDGDEKTEKISISHAKLSHDDSTELRVLSIEDHPGASITELRPGQNFYITSSGYDERGHKITEHIAGFKLPQTEAEVELDDVKKRLDNLEKFDINITDNLEKNYYTKDYTDRLYTSIDNRLDLVEEFKEEIPNTYATKEETGSVAEMKIDNSDAYADYTSIASLIGNIEALNVSLGFNPQNGKQNVMSLSEALMLILPNIQSKSEMIFDSYGNMKARIEALEAKVETLENK